MWLDLLPLDICERIAAHVSGGSQNREALFLAEASRRQRRAILRVLRFKFENSTEKGSEQLSLNARWANIFSSDTKAIKFPPEAFPIRYQDSSDSLALFKAPKLRTVSIWDDPIVLLAAGQSKSIRELEIYLTSYSPPNLIFETLSALKLTNLKIHCWEETPESLCLFKHMSSSKSKQAMLANVCPGLTSLEINCDCSADVDPLVNVLPTISSLREVKIRLARKSSMPYLRRFHSVKVFDLINCHQAVEMALLIGIPITEISSCARLDSDEICGLSCFPRLTVLRCTMGEEAEYALADIAWTLTSLRVLDLSWRTPLEITRRENATCLADIESGVLLDTVRALPNLMELHLTYLYISLSEIVAILKCLGSRLEKLGTDIWDQEKRPIERLECLLYCASKHNPSLRCLEVVPAGLEYIGHGLREYEVERHGLRALAALNRLRQNAPFFDPSPLDVILEALIENF